MTDEVTAAPETGAEPSAAPVVQTEADVWGSERSQPRDDRGRFATPQQEPAAAPVEPAQPQQEAVPQPPAAPQQAAQQQPDVKAIVAEVLKAQQPQPAQPAQPPAPQQPQDAEPDMFSDPAGWRAWNQRQADARDYHTRLNVSLALVQEKSLTDYAEMEALAVEASQSDPRIAAQIMAAPLPALAAYQIGQKVKAMREIGDDPAAYREKVRAEIRAELEAEHAARSTQPATPAAPAERPALPASLAAARDTGGRNSPPSAPPSEAEVWGGRRGLPH